jgi:hypothetical protein
MDAYALKKYLASQKVLKSGWVSKKSLLKSWVDLVAKTLPWIFAFLIIISLH